MRLLIYGAGVIGSLYAVLFSGAGYDTAVYARGGRLDALKKDGLLYRENGRIHRADVAVLSELRRDDLYDFIFLTVREEQLYQALEELRNNQSPCIVTMVNSIDNYEKWEQICGKGRILPAFPGAGGSISNHVLDAALTPRLIQPTTFAEITGMNTERTKELSAIFRKSHIPYQKVRDMHLWQLCHLALVVPLADAYYEAADPKQAGKEEKLMYLTAGRLKRNLRLLRTRLGSLSPGKLYLFLPVPSMLLAAGLSFVYNSRFGDRFMYQHSLKAPDEMRRLHRQLYDYLEAGESSVS